MKASSQDCFDYHRDLFVDRDQEIDQFMRIVRATDRTKYLEFVGVSGQGKTELLKWIAYKAREQGYLPVYLDFSNNLFQRPEIFPLLEETAEQLDEMRAESPFRSFWEILPKYKDALRHFYKESWLSDTVDAKPFIELESKLIDSFSNGLTAVAEKSIIVLCMDSSEKAYDRSFREFENNILSRYSNNANFMIVTAGQTPVKWESETFPKESKDYIEPTRLSPLDQNNAVAQIERIAECKGRSLANPDLIGNKLFEITLGHPFSNFQLVDYWLDAEKSDKLSPELFEKQLSVGLRVLIKRFIEKQILMSVYIDQTIYPSPIEILRHLSPLRHIDFAIIWFVLTNFLPDWFDEQQDFAHVERLLNRLANSFVFLPRGHEAGYIMEPVVKNILLYDLKKHDMNKYLEIERAITSQYGYYARQTSASQIHFFVEHLYHHACYIQNDAKHEMREELESRLDRFLIDISESDSASPEIIRQQLINLEDKIRFEEKRDFGICKLSTDVDINTLATKISKCRNQIRGSHK